MSIPLQYQLYCETEAANIVFWLDTTPTVCPNNASHDISAETIVELRHPNAFYRSGAITKRNLLAEPQEVVNISWPGPEYAGNIIAIEIVSYITTEMDYTVKLVDSSANIIAEATFDNTMHIQQLLGEILYQPSKGVLTVVISRDPGDEIEVRICDLIVYTDL